MGARQAPRYVAAGIGPAVGAGLHNPRPLVPAGGQAAAACRRERPYTGSAVAVNQRRREGMSGSEGASQRASGARAPKAYSRKPRAARSLRPSVDAASPSPARAMDVAWLAGPNRRRPDWTARPRRCGAGRRHRGPAAPGRRPGAARRVHGQTPPRSGRQPTDCGRPVWRNRAPGRPGPAPVPR